MESTVKDKRLRIGGMTCVQCQNKIEQKLRRTAGVKSVKVSYGDGTADLTYDADLISLRDIQAVIEKLGYRVLSESGGPAAGRAVGTLVLIAALFALLQRFGVLSLLVPSRLADTRTGYGMLFVVGLLTSIHCVAMCGGINLSQCLPRREEPALPAGGRRGKSSALAPAFLYNLGRVVSYTAVGFILGLAGFLLGGDSAGGLPAVAQGLLKLIAGGFMVLMGINMLGLFPWLRKWQPRMPDFLARKVHTEKARRRGPLIVGLLNGLMPCGPLQSMQIVALASGNPFAGALSMLLFSLGTVPLMLGLGSLVSALGRKFTDKVMQIGAVLVVVLGLAMLSQGGSLSGLLSPELLLAVVLGLCAVGAVSRLPFRTSWLKAAATAAMSVTAAVAITAWSAGAAVGAAVGGSAGDGARMVGDTQVVNSTLSSGSYPSITVRVGVPVKWIIDAPEGSVNGCNYKINIREFGITGYTFQNGENVIEFTPAETGAFPYSCWMGMIRGTITVTDAQGGGAEGPIPAAQDDGSGALPSCCG